MNNPKPSGKNILCIGEAMLELSLTDTENAQVKFAGDTLNTAIYLQRHTGTGNKVSYCTVVGQDALSNRLVDFIKSEGIDVNTIQRLDDRTIGLYAISTDESGERSFTYWRNQSAARTLFQHDGKTDFGLLSDFDVIYLSAITLAILPGNIRQGLLQAISGLREKGKVQFAFDSNYRPALWESQAVAREIIAAFWKVADIALPSIDDEQALFEDPDEPSLIARLKSYGINQGVLKRGEIGPLSLAEDAATLPADQMPPVDVIDTTAAGDSFNAGYLSALLNNEPQLEALLAGHHCAARVITYRGAIIPMHEW